MGTEPDGTEYVWGNYEGTNQWISFSKDLSGYQKKLIAGDNISISGDTISALDAQIERTFTTTTTVGHLPAGTVITSEQTLRDIIFNMLCGDEPSIHYAQYLESSYIPDIIDSNWIQSEISETVKVTGLTFTTLGLVPVGYISFAYSKNLGPLTHIYQNGLPIDILTNWEQKSIMYKSTY